MEPVADNGLDASLVRKLEIYTNKDSLEKVKKAYRFALDKHQNQYRKSGEAFIMHPVAVAELLADLRLDFTSIIAALLHDVVEDTDVSLEQIKKQFGPEVTNLIDGLTKLDLIKFSTQEEEQAENIRKMILAMAKDIRVVLIKLADRLHNMQTISHLGWQQQTEKAKETLEIYAPLSHRLGISQFKWQLEDLSFQVIEPQKYVEIKRMVAEKREQREQYLEDVIKVLNDSLHGSGVKVEISGRPKHLYSIYQKMIKKGKEFSEIYDLTAMRLIVETVPDCYTVLGTLHNLWKPIPGRFKDYIAMPKFNLYQSLHTTVIGPQGKPLEVQVRTSDMHNVAEFGIAAHWKYKHAGDVKSSELPWIKSILEWQTDLKDAVDFVETLKIDLFHDEVFVFTPKGRVISLPAGATPIDFAYLIHTDIGNSCVGALINNRIVPLGYRLSNGDIIEILTSKNAHPSKDWLQIAETPKARSRIRQWFVKNRQEDSQQLGKEVLQKAMRKKRLAASISQIGGLLEKIAKEYNFKNSDVLVSSIGEGVTSVSQVVSKLANLIKEEEKDTGEVVEQAISVKPRRKPLKTVAVKVHGVDDVLVRLARCCNPMPGDEIMGFITIGRGISVHSRECRNVPALLRSPERKVEVSWENRQDAAFKVEIEVVALDRKGLLKDITISISDAKINIDSAKVSINKDKTAVFRFMFETSSVNHLASVLSSIKRIDSILDVYRVLPQGRAKIAEIK